MQAAASAVTPAWGASDTKDKQALQKRGVYVTAEALQRCKQVLDALDFANQGHLTLQAFAPSQGNLLSHGKRCQAIFGYYARDMGMDMSGDGKISFGEFEAFVLKAAFADVPLQGGRSLPAGSVSVETALNYARTALSENVTAVCKQLWPQVVELREAKGQLAQAAGDPAF